MLIRSREWILMKWNFFYLNSVNELCEEIVVLCRKLQFCFIVPSSVHWACAFRNILLISALHDTYSVSLREFQGTLAFFNGVFTFMGISLAVVYTSIAWYNALAWHLSCKTGNFMPWSFFRWGLWRHAYLVRVVRNKWMSIHTWQNIPRTFFSFFFFIKGQQTPYLLTWCINSNMHRHCLVHKFLFFLHVY